MKTVTLEVRSLKDSLKDVAQAMKSLKAQRTARISFDSAELLWEVLTARRLEILRVLTGSGALSIREIARRVGRDVKAVHAGVHALLGPGVVDRDEEGKIFFRYQAVRVDFKWSAVA